MSQPSKPDTELRALDLLMRLTALPPEQGGRCRWCGNATGHHGQHRSHCAYGQALDLLDSPDDSAEETGHIVTIEADADGGYPAVAIVSRMMMPPAALDRLRQSLALAMKDGSSRRRPIVIEAIGLEVYQLIGGRRRPLARRNVATPIDQIPCDESA